jgi:DNA modification methylase
MRVHGEYSEEHLAKFRFKDEETGGMYMKDNLQNPNPNRPNLTYEWNGHTRCWRWTKERMQKAHDSGMIVYADNGMPYQKRYLDSLMGPTIGDTWTDIAPVNSQASERANYPTQKPEELIERVLESTCFRGKLVLDCFIGSGTTAAVAQRSGRRWIGCDINKGAIQTTSKRLQNIIAEQIAARDKQAAEDAQSLLPPDDEEGETTDQPAKPAQFLFSV